MNDKLSKELKELKEKLSANEDLLDLTASQKEQLETIITEIEDPSPSFPDIEVDVNETLCDVTQVISVEPIKPWPRKTT
jgi:hypothetical protein